jgi:hypothetical protein
MQIDLNTEIYANPSYDMNRHNYSSHVNPVTPATINSLTPNQSFSVNMRDTISLALLRIF